MIAARPASTRCAIATSPAASPPSIPPGGSRDAPTRPAWQTRILLFRRSGSRARWRARRAGVAGGGIALPRRDGLDRSRALSRRAAEAAAGRALARGADRNGPQLHQARPDALDARRPDRRDGGPDLSDLQDRLPPFPGTRGARDRSSGAGRAARGAVRQFDDDPRLGRLDRPGATCARMPPNRTAQSNAATEVRPTERPARERLVAVKVLRPGIEAVLASDDLSFSWGWPAESAPAQPRCSASSRSRWSRLRRADRAPGDGPAHGGRRPRRWRRTSPTTRPTACRRSTGSAARAGADHVAGRTASLDDRDALLAAGHDLHKVLAQGGAASSSTRCSATASSTATSIPATCSSTPTATSARSISASWAGSTGAPATISPTC